MILKKAGIVDLGNGQAYAFHVYEGGSMTDKMKIRALPPAAGTLASKLHRVRKDLEREEKDFEYAAQHWDTHRELLMAEREDLEKGLKALGVSVDDIDWPA